MTGGQNPPEFPVVAVCGSRSGEELRQAEADLALDGRIALLPFTGAHLARGPIGDEQRLMLTRLHRAKIAMADEVLFVNPERYVNDAAIDELAFAIGRRRPVRFTQPPVTMSLREDFWTAMLAGEKTCEVRRYDGKRAKIEPGQLLRFTCGDRSLLARVATIAISADPRSMLERHDPSTIMRGADREQLAKTLEEFWPGLLDTDTAMIVIKVTVLGEQRPATAAPAWALPRRPTFTWHDGLPPEGVPVTGAAGWLVDPMDGRVLLQARPDGRFTLPGGRIEDADAGDLVATLAREAAEESQVEIDAACAVYLGCVIVTGHPDRPDPHAKARFLAPITLYEPIGPDADCPAVIYRRLMTSLDRAPALLAGGDPGRHEVTAARAAARALGFPVDEPRDEGFRDGGDPDPAFGPDGLENSGRP